MFKICLALPKAPAGGSYTFMRYFREYLSAQGIAWTHDLHEDYDVLFVNSWTIPYAVVLKAKRERPALRVVHRVDGAAQDYGRRDGVDWLQRDVNHLADLTIFQSQYSYQATHKRYKLIKVAGPIIHNPVDCDLFSPQGERFDWQPQKIRLISVGWSPNPLKGNWRIPILAAQNPDIEFVVVGQSAQMDRLPNIRRLEYMDHGSLPKALRSADIYLSLIRNDACPNVILEALASGLPILYVPSGGVPELVREAGLPFETDQEFGIALSQLLANRARYAAAARQTALEHHHPELIFARYLEAINACQRRPLPAAALNWRAFLDQKAFEWRDFLNKWKRILSGRQPLRNPNKR